MTDATFSPRSILFSVCKYNKPLLSERQGQKLDICESLVPEDMLPSTGLSWKHVCPATVSPHDFYNVLEMYKMKCMSTRFKPHLSCENHCTTTILACCLVFAVLV